MLGLKLNHVSKSGHWFCYHLIAKPGNKTGAPLWPDPYNIRYQYNIIIGGDSRL